MRDNARLPERAGTGIGAAFFGIDGGVDRTGVDRELGIPGPVIHMSRPGGECGPAALAWTRGASGQPPVAEFRDLTGLDDVQVSAPAHGSMVVRLLPEFVPEPSAFHVEMCDQGGLGYNR